MGLDQSLERRQICEPESGALGLRDEAPMFELNERIRQIGNSQSQQVGHESRGQAIGYEGWIATFMALLREIADKRAATR
jgi:hypothetical protein